MINRIFNWTAGSFFRTLGRFIFYGIVVFLLSLLFSRCEVKAINMTSWYNSTDYIISPRAYIYNISSNNTYTNVGTLETGSNGTETIEFYTLSNSNYVFGSNGMGLSFVMNQSLYKGYMYAIAINLCNGGSYLPTDKNNFIFSFSNTGTNYKTNTATVYYQTYKTISNSPLVGNTFGVCNQYFYVFRANGQGTYAEMKMKGTGQNAYGLSFLGYNIENLGYANNLSEGEISNIISSSGLASAESVEDVQRSINQVQKEINGMQQAQQETNDKLDKTNEELGEMNDYIQDDTPASTEDIDMDSLGTVSGLLPAGPVDSLLNIPFTFLSVLTSSMSGTCVPITGTFVFDSTLSIPCFDSFYDHVPDYLMNFINLIPAGFILILYFKHLYKKVDRAVSLQSTADDEWGVI